MPGGGGGGGAAKAAGAVAVGGALLGLAAMGMAKLDEERKRKAQAAAPVQMSAVPSPAAAPPRTLVLWDIDDTMTQSAHASGIAGGPILQAVSEVVGRPISKQGLSFNGKTDTGVVRELLVANGVELDPRARLDVEHAVFKKLPDVMAAGVADGRFSYVPLPGVADLLRELQQRYDVVLGLLTGNLEGCCPVKLGAAGFDHSIFALGACESSPPRQPPPPSRSAVSRRCWYS